MTYLKTLDFDELLQTVNDVELILLIVVGNVSCVKPASAVDRFLSRLWVVVITLHYLRAINAHLAFLPRSQRLARVHVDDLDTRPRDRLTK